MAWSLEPGTHAGYTVACLADGTEVNTWSPNISTRVIGWRSACVCGWRSAAYFDRTEWPSEDGFVPPEIDGDDEHDGLAYREWDEHVRERRRTDWRCVVQVGRAGVRRLGWTSWTRP